MQELEKRIGLLRLLLADIHGKHAQLAEMETQYKEQLARIVDFVVYRDGNVANALSLMSEVQGKLDEVIHTTRHLQMIRDRANSELDALVLTKRVAEARSQLAELQARQQELSSRLAHLPDEQLGPAEPSGIAGDRESVEHIDEEVAEIAAQMARLNRLITEASERAARTIQPGKSV